MEAVPQIDSRNFVTDFPSGNISKLIHPVILKHGTAALTV